MDIYRHASPTCTKTYSRTTVGSAMSALQHPYKAGVRMTPFILVVYILQEVVAFLRLHSKQYGIDLGLDPVVALLGLRRADVQQNGQARDLPKQLQELRLPVLQRVTHHLHGVVADFDRLLVSKLLVRVGIPTEYPVTGERDQK